MARHLGERAGGAPEERHRDAGWRDVLLSRLVWAAFLMGAPAVAFAIYTRPVPRPSVFAVVLVGSYVVMAALLLLPFRSVITRAWVFAAGLLSVGTTAFLSTGYMPGAALCYVTAAVTVGLLIGPRWGAALIVLEAGAIVLVGALATRGGMEVAQTVAREASLFKTWIRAALAFLSLGMALLGIVTSAVKQIEAALRAKTDALARLTREQMERARAEQERHQAERAMLEAQKAEAIGRLAGGVAHDFNNALLVILGWAELLRRRAGKDQELDAAVSAIATAANRSAQLTQRLLSLGRRDVRSPRAVPMAGFLREFAATLGRLLPASVQLELTVEPTAPAWVDEAQLDHALLNLAINARDAMPNGGRLRIHCHEVSRAQLPRPAAGSAQRFVAIGLQDNGVGIDPATLERIFEPFFTKKATSGSGLGLASVEAIARQHGGAIAAQSVEGEGSTFTLYLPVADPILVQPDLALQAPVGSAPPCTILVAEDEPEVRGLMVRSLRQAGHHVLEAGDATEALALARASRQPIDLLCSDGVMPGMDTRQLVASFTRLFPTAGVLICSGYLESDVLRDDLAQGRYAFLAKPFAPTTLIGKVDELLAVRRSRERPIVTTPPA